MKLSVGLAVAAVLLGASLAQATPPNSQAIYDAAQAAFDKSDWANAATGFSQLLPTDAAKPLSRSEAVIASRFASALMHLNRLDEATAWIDRALPALPTNDPATTAEAFLTKGDIARYIYDYSAALSAFRKADEAAGPLGVTDLLVAARVGEALAGTTIEPAYVQAQLADLLARPDFSKRVARQMVTQVEDLQARAAINAGDKKTASKLAERVVEDSGGLTTQVTLAQIAIRADAGVIARLNHDDTAAQRYLAYTGAGHLKSTTWITNHNGELPVCGDDDDGIRPDDSAVVTFAIAADGRVAGALPIYASRPGQIGVAFARALSGWSWSPDDLKKIDPFWRVAMQLELRCVTRPSPQALSAPIRRDAAEWLAGRGLLTEAEIRRGGAETSIQISASDPRFSHPGGVALSAMFGPSVKNEAAFQRTWSGLDAAAAPASIYAIFTERAAHGRSGETYDHSGYWKRVASMIATSLPALERRFPKDRAVTWLTLTEALALQDGGDFRGAQPIFAKLLAETGVAKSDPLASVAFLHQAIGFDHVGDAAGARSSLEQSGLTEQKCSLIDTHPIARDHSASSDNYPDAAQRWMFEGFAQEAFDIADDGGVKNVRTVVAYPPYIFEQSSERIARNFRYLPPRLGGKAVGCESQQQIINYRLAD